MSTAGADAIRDLLAGIDFFKGCTERELRDIAHLTDERRVQAGAELCHQDDFENDVYVIVEGEADVIVNGSPVSTAGVGEIVGELSMLGTGRRAATLRAVTPMRVLVLDPREIDSVLAADPSSARSLSQHRGPASPDS
jgi:CRP-like cAMP-binding protein